MDISEQKKQLRDSLQTLSFDQKSQLEAQSKIISKVNQLIQSYQPSSVLSYFGFKDEPQIETIDTGEGHSYYPKIEDFEKKTMKFYSWSLGDGYKENRYGIKEPMPHKMIEIDPKDSMILIPGLLFDYNGNRLGYGGGYYDRYLNAHDFKLKVGVCYEQRINPELPVTKEDIRMDMVITEKRIFYT